MNQAFELLALADVIAGALTGAEVHLYQNNVIFNPDTTVIGDLTEATYVGYVAQAVVWGVASVSDDGHVESIAVSLIFRPTNGVTPNDIYGYYIDDGAGVLLGGGSFDGAPLPMHSALDVITMTVVYRLVDEGYVSVVS